MSKRTVCDVCGDTIDGTPKITSTENDGTNLDFCSTGCFMEFTRSSGATK